MTIATFGTVSTSVKSAVTAEAEAIGALRESDAVDIEFASD
jgi:hypothetical protein